MQYDYVIVGAGSAGCVLADRLSVDPSVRVALLEAGGPDRKAEIRVPAAFSKMFKTEYDWNFSTVKQAEMSGRELYWPRGRTLGGSSSINAQMWVRGHRADYDGWELPGWSYDEVLPYFRRSEHRTGSNHGGVYGTGGPIHISELRSPNVTTAAFLRACEEIGLTRLDELGESDEGCSPTPVTQRRGRRWSCADAYLRPAMRRPNLTVLTGAEARGVLFDDDGRATGVEYGDGLRVTATREVILSAGTIGSPQLLMRSGIGDPGELRAAGVEPRHELPGVGSNLSDHLACGVVLSCPSPVTLAAAESLGNLARFLLAGRGMLTSNVGEAVAFVRSGPAEPAPDLELVFAPVPFADHGLTPPAGHGLTIGVVLLRPESRGRVTLGEDGGVLIDPCYLSAETDVLRLVAGLKKAKELFAAPSLKPYAGTPMEPYDGSETDEELARLVRAKSETLYHPVGTCKMGLGPDAVVDPSLRVRGVPGLRVVDASVMPALNRGHTHAPTVMIAERAADLIKASGEGGGV
ncbi:GMC family oxidoreductase [Sphaerisporangium aureirubrum]|uniref:GMC family oxidoreductase n=1 Tax=Sphaerisporangium aureirubrum TaxID=1544736 RepID=A0ABW1NDA0_9ACTN